MNDPSPPPTFPPEQSYHSLLNPQVCRCSAPVRQRVIRTIDLFRGASGGTWADLEFLMKSRGFRDGQEVSPPAEGDGILGIVVGGAFKIQRWVTCEQYVVVDVLGPGEHFLFGHSDRVDVGFHGYPDVIKSLTTSCLLTMSLGELWPLLARDQVLAPRFLGQLTKRMGQLSDRFSRFLVFPAEHRLAYLILHLQTKGSPKPWCPGLVPFNLTRKDLAAMGGLTLETASRVLSGWERQTWIRSGRGWIEVLNGPALEALCRTQGAAP